MFKCTMHYLIHAFVTLCILHITICQEWVVKSESCRTPNGYSGKCISIKECKPMINFLKTLKRPYSQYVVSKLNDYKCSDDSNQVDICCPSTTINIVDPTVSTTEAPVAEPPDVSSHRNLKLLPESCGYLKDGDKIRNGVNASLNEFPWMAQISYKTDEGSKFRCGGTIINDRFILTAAHCLSHVKYPLDGVRVGEYDTSSEEDCEIRSDGTKKCNAPVQDLAIQAIIPHPQYSRFKLINDIGLIKVDKMNLSIKSARPVCLPLESAKNQKFNYATVTGWGFTGPSGTTTSILQRVELPIIKFENCQKFYKKSQNVALTKKQFCAGGEDQRDSCKGDSGGPLQAAAFINGEIRYVQQGVVSFGPIACGMDGFPGVYTSVAYYMDWILDNLTE